MNLDEYTTSFLPYAPAKNPHGWQLDLNAFGQALREAFPDVGYRPEEGHPARLGVWGLTADGTEFDGFAGNETRDTIALRGNAVAEVAPFIAWLRDHYIASPDLIRFTSEAAFARGVETHWRIPATGGADRIEENCDTIYWSWSAGRSHQRRAPRTGDLPTASARARDDGPRRWPACAAREPPASRPSARSPALPARCPTTSSGGGPASVAGRAPARRCSAMCPRSG
jgi:hypothetical protein